MPLPCALKSTGDGFLLAVELAHGHKEVPIELQSALAEPLTRGLTNFVREAKRSGTFRCALEKFFGIWQDYLAQWLQPATFRVAGAIAIGTGQVLDKEDVPKKWTAAKFLKGVLGTPSEVKLKSDAYGHGVNLAFRLCDRAGRETKKGPNDVSPYVLLDRRIGQLLIEGLPEETSNDWVTFPWEKKKNVVHRPFKMRTFKGYSPIRFPFDKPLKGIDELWCYGLKEEDPSTTGRSVEGSLETGPTEESGEAT